MKKLERYEYNCMGYVCTDEDVAELEASHAELLAAAKSVLAWYDFYSPNYYNELHEKLRAAIAKAEGEGV